MFARVSVTVKSGATTHGANDDRDEIAGDVVRAERERRRRAAVPPSMLGMLNQGDRPVRSRHREGDAVARHAADRHDDRARSSRRSARWPTMLVADPVVVVAVVPLKVVLVPVAPNWSPVIVTDVPTFRMSATGS